MRRTPTTDEHPALLSPDEVRHRGDDAAKRVLEWVEGYLGAPNAEPRLERPHVCPFIPGALKRGTLKIATLRGIHDAAGTEEAIRHFRDVFVELPPSEGPELQSKTILVVFPDVADDAADVAIDAVQRAVKPSFVIEHQVMVGELHPNNRTEAAGHEGMGIYPNRSPVPLLALRPVVPGDEKFLLRPDLLETDAETYWGYLGAFHRGILKLLPRTAAANRDRQRCEIYIRQSEIMLRQLSGGRAT